MKNIDLWTSVTIVAISILFTTIISRIIPEKQFDSYQLELDSVWQKQANEQEYWIDIKADQIPEKIVHHHINISGHSIEYVQEGKLRQIYIFKNSETFIGSTLVFADIDQNLTKELLFVSVRKDTAYLNILSYDLKEKLLMPIEKIAIDAIKRYKEKVDVVNNFIINSDSAIFLDLQSGYMLQPRNIYKYNLKQKKLTKNRLNSFVSPKAEFLNYRGQIFLLATYVKATGNTISHKEADQLRKSTHKDTIAIYQELKNLEYSYGDFSSYLLLYNDSLGFAFEPIEFFGWTNFTKAIVCHIDSVPHIVAFTNAQMNEPDNNKSKLLTVCDLQGKIIKQTPIQHNYSDIFAGNDKLIFYADKVLYVQNKKLETLLEIDEITHAQGFIDVNLDKIPEFVAFQNNCLILFSEEFEIKASFKIAHEFAPYPDENGIEVLKINHKNSFIYSSRLFYYQFSFHKNTYSILKYPFYFVLFLAWSSLLYFMLKMNRKRLEKEKLQLEEIVNQRTVELQSKNLALASQKEEIQNQAEKISQQYLNLAELNQFKELYTQTLVHDLKNPLSQILSATNSPCVQRAASKMLRLILNLLDVEKYEKTNFNIEKEQQSLRAVLEEVQTGQQSLLNEKNLSLKFHFNDFEVLADKQIIVRIFDNLFSNAIQHSQQNQAIEIFAEKTAQGTIKIGIKNYGSTIKEEDLPHIFEKFTYFRKKTNSNHYSTGLGLTFCKMAIEAHGHSIQAENQADGVLFQFTLDGEKTVADFNFLEEKSHQINLTHNELALLQPFLDQLKQFDVFEVTDILEILTRIPEESENIAAFKRNLETITFSMNVEYYNAIVKK